MCYNQPSPTPPCPLFPPPPTVFANPKLLVLLYLAAIVVANLTVAAFGPAALYVNAFVLIGLDLSCRDRLHDSWRRQGLGWKMGLLILTGSCLSWLLSPTAGRVASASLVAFALAATGDALVYQVLQQQPYLVRSNGSNVVGAMVDSLAFPTLAFGEFSVVTSLLQFCAKFLGGFLWSLLLNLTPPKGWGGSQPRLPPPTPPQPPRRCWTEPANPPKMTPSSGQPPASYRGLRQVPDPPRSG
jgi:hypothetical protein